MILKDRVVVVTGAGSGIGRAGAELMAKEGATVVVSDVSEERSNETRDSIKSAGGTAVSIPTDVTDDAAVRHLIDEAVRRFAKVDVLHSHAGIQVGGSLEEIDVDGMDASWNLNVRAHFVATKHVMPYMQKQGGGSIIITASNSGVFMDKAMLAYITTKTAVIAMARQIALDYAKDNVRVNALCPGFVDTPFNLPYEQVMGGRLELEKYVSEHIPLERFANVGEIAQSILFLASDASAFMTGHAFVIDGGECFA